MAIAPLNNSLSKPSDLKKLSKLTKSNKEAGFSMIEVLITILVFAVGLLGVAAMQVQALKGTSDGGQRGKAVWLAQEITERMRANPTGVENGDYILASISCPASPPAKACSDYYDGSSLVSSVSCTSSELAEFDLWELTCGTYDPATNGDRKGSPINFLAGAELSIGCDSCASTFSPTLPIDTNANFIIDISWTGRGGDASKDTASKVQSVQLLVRP